MLVFGKHAVNIVRICYYNSESICNETVMSRLSIDDVASVKEIKIFPLFLWHSKLFENNEYFCLTEYSCQKRSKCSVIGK